MALPFFPANKPAAPPTDRWWLSLFPRFSATTKRSLLLLSLSAALLINSQLQISNQQQTITSNSPYALPAVQHALQQLNLPARDPVGNQFQINTYTTNHQVSPAVALDSDGDFVVVWMSYSSSGDTSGRSIQGQRYNSVGTAQGGQFQINTYTTNHQENPAVSMDSDGDFVVVWHSLGSSGSDNNFTSIQGQRYNAAGTPQGNEFQINTYTTDLQAFPAVALDSDGDFVVVWQSFGSSGSDTNSDSIQGQRYNAAGTPQGSQFQVNTYTTNFQWLPAVALDSNGDFVVVWQSNGSSSGDTSVYSIQGQRYNAAGTPQGSQFQINTYTTSAQAHPAISLDSDGDFVVVWQSNGSSGGDTSGYSIQGQRYNAAGTPQGSQFQVNSYATSTQRFPAISLDSTGDFVIVWDSNGSSGGDTSGYSIQGQRYNAAGTPQGSQFQVNTYTTNDQRGPDVSLDIDGDFIIVWRSNGSSDSDTDGHSIQGQRFVAEGSTPTPTPTFTPSVTPSNTPTHTATPSATSSSTPTYTLTPSATSNNTPTHTPTPSATSNSSPTPTRTPSPTPTSPAGPIRVVYLPAIIGDEFPYFDEPCEDEPNDVVEEANGYLRSGQNYCGYPNDNKDFFSVYLPTAGTISADLTNHTGEGVQLQLFYQSTNNLVDHDTGLGDLHVEHNGPAGIYYLYIFTLSGFNSTTPYTLVVNFP
jgi:hypothetical protein